MHIPNFLFLIFSLFFAPQPSPKVDYQASKGIMSPMPAEKLPQPIKLKGPCQGVSIIEWRGSSIDYKSVKVIQKTCKLAVTKFEKFIQTQPSYKLSEPVTNFDTQLCLLPLNSKPRNLNDIKYRFVRRVVKEDVWGYYQIVTDNIYIRNDPYIGNQVNPQFRRVLAHEIFHAMSYQYGISEQHSDDQSEERLAEKFTRYLRL